MPLKIKQDSTFETAKIQNYFLYFQLTVNSTDSLLTGFYGSGKTPPAAPYLIEKKSLNACPGGL